MTQQYQNQPKSAGSQPNPQDQGQPDRNAPGRQPQGDKSAYGKPEERDSENKNKGWDKNEKDEKDPAFRNR